MLPDDPAAAGQGLGRPPVLILFAVVYNLTGVTVHCTPMFVCMCGSAPASSDRGSKLSVRPCNLHPCPETLGAYWGMMQMRAWFPLAVVLALVASPLSGQEEEAPTDSLSTNAGRYERAIGGVVMLGSFAGIVLGGYHCGEPRGFAATVEWGPDNCEGFREHVTTIGGFTAVGAVAGLLLGSVGAALAQGTQADFQVRPARHQPGRLAIELRVPLAWLSPRVGF